MLQPSMVKSILEKIGKGEYVGTPLCDIYTHFVGQDLQAAEENDYLKFVYHMDQLYDAGLFEPRNISSKNRWGKSQSLGDTRSYTNVNLLLTPIGSEVLKELNKPKGLEKFIQSIRSAGATAGKEALRYGVSDLLKGLSS